MRLEIFIIPAALLFQAAGAQNSSGSLTVSPGAVTAASVTPVSEVATTPTLSASSTLSTPVPESDQISIMDYKSVYEAATLEEEVQMATERFKLTPSQQDVWLTAATDRRVIEKQVYEKLDSKSADYSRDAMYRALRSSHNTFYEAIIGYLNPAQKQAIEFDRTILQEKQKRLAKLPPPPPPAPTVTVAPVDSTAIKAAEKAKAGSKKSRKKKKAVGA